MKKKNEDNEQIFNLDDVIAGHKADLALAQVAEVLCALYGIAMREVNDYLIPNTDRPCSISSQ